jgi:hypothetical protein
MIYQKKKIGTIQQNKTQYHNNNSFETGLEEYSGKKRNNKHSNNPHDCG